MSSPNLLKLSESLNKKFGVDRVDPKNYKINVIPTGIMTLDLATGIGGYPRGRIIEIAGWEASGKTTHALWAAKEVQKVGGTVAFIDVEYALDPRWVDLVGVDMSDDKFLWLRGYSLEDMGETITDLSDAGVDLIIFDSVAAAPIKAVNQGELGDANMGKVAKIMADLMRKITGPIARNDTCMIFINQLYESMDPYSPQPVTPGGKKLKFHASMRIFLTAKKSKTDEGHTDFKARIEKNKMSPPNQIAEYSFDSNANLDPLGQLVTVLTHKDFMDRLGVQRAGAWYTLPNELFPDMEEPKFQGSAKLAEALSEVEVFERADAYVREKLGIPS